MILVFGKVQNVEGALNAGHFAGCDADPHIGVESAANHQKAVIAAVFDASFIDDKDAGQRILDHIDGRDTCIGRQRQRAGQQQPRFDGIETPLTNFGEARRVRAECVSVIGRDAARELGDMHTKLKVLPCFDN